MFPGVESGTLKALNYYLTNQDLPGDLSFQYKLAMGLGAGLTDLCKMMILSPEDPDYSTTLSLLYDISSRIKVDPLLAQLFGASGDTLKDIIDSIATDPTNPMGLAGKILIILPVVINPLLGKTTFFLF